MLPVFPEFKKLTLSDKALIQKITSPFGDSSDYNFLSLWSYNTEDDALVATFEENLVIRFRDYITNEHFFSFIGKNQVAKTITTLLSRAKDEGVKQELNLIIEESLSDRSLFEEFAITEDRGNFDYILSIQEIKELHGKKYHTQKNHVNRFHTLYPNAKTVKLDLSDRKVKQQILDVFYRWEKGKEKKRKETQHELTALKRTLRHSHLFKLLPLGIYDKNALIGFAIIDIEHPQYAQNHFAKSDPLYKEVYYKLNNASGELLDSLGYKFINIECDLGLSGLRYAKEQWNPIHYVKKYTISPKS